MNVDINFISVKFKLPSILPAIWYVGIYIPGVLFLMMTTKSDSVGAASILTLRLNVSPSMTRIDCPEIDITDIAMAEKKEREISYG